jgi:hypothetical protein
MGILLNALGDEPIVRLQTGGLRAAEFIYRGGIPTPGAIAGLVIAGSGGDGGGIQISGVVSVPINKR